MFIGTCNCHQWSCAECRYYSATIYNMAGFGERASIWLAGFTALAQSGGVGAGVALIEKRGRRSLLLTSLAAVAGALALLGFSFYLQVRKHPHTSSERRSFASRGMSIQVHGDPHHMMCRTMYDNVVAHWGMALVMCSGRWYLRGIVPLSAALTMLTAVAKHWQLRCYAEVRGLLCACWSMYYQSNAGLFQARRTHPDPSCSSPDPLFFLSTSHLGLKHAGCH